MRVWFPRRPEGGTGALSVVAGWFLATVGVLDELRPELSPLQGRLAFDIIEQWSRVVPWTLGPDAEHRVLTEETAHKVRALFDEVDTLASLVRIFRTLLPHHAMNTERDAAISRDANAYCREKSDAIAEFMRQGAFEAEGWLLERLVEHCKQLLRVVLGDRLMQRFIERYNTAMRDLAKQAKLNDTPPN